MSVELHEQIDGKLLEVHASDKLTKQDYERFVPQFEQLIARHGKLRVLFIMEDFHGWEAGALWEDIQVDVKHFSDIQRLAMVGDKAWEEGMSFFCRPFTAAEIRYFSHHEIERAREWVTEGLVAADRQNTPS